MKKGIKKYKFSVTKSHEIIKYSTENMVNNIIIIMYGFGSILDLMG